MVLEPSEVAHLVERSREGSPEAASALFACLYGELHALAGRIGGRGRGTLTPTALVNEAYLKLVRPEGSPPIADRVHFLNLAARAMRQVLVNHARDRAAAKRGGNRERERITVVVAETPAAEGGTDLLDLHEALGALEQVDARQAAIAELKLFGGLSTAEIALLQGVSTRTVELDWRMAKEFLARTLQGGKGAR